MPGNLLLFSRLPQVTGIAVAIKIASSTPRQKNALVLRHPRAKIQPAKSSFDATVASAFEPVDHRNTRRQFALEDLFRASVFSSTMISARNEFAVGSNQACARRAIRRAGSPGRNYGSVRARRIPSGFHRRAAATS